MRSSVLEGVLSLLWPSRCPGCSRAAARAEVFCRDCSPALLPLDGACPGCALPLSPKAVGGDGAGRCAGCRMVSFPFSCARAACGYGGPLKQAILRLKHGGRRDVARPLGRLLAPALGAQLAAVDAVLPVPLHPRRLRTRGYNQALELLRRALGALHQAGGERPALAVLIEALRRVRDSAPLGHESRAERLRRLRGVFEVAQPERVEGRVLLLVDDVMTTGATLGECARSLLESGAAEVRAVVLARAL